MRVEHLEIEDAGDRIARTVQQVREVVVAVVPAERQRAANERALEPPLDRLERDARLAPDDAAQVLEPAAAEPGEFICVDTYGRLGRAPQLAQGLGGVDDRPVVAAGPARVVDAARLARHGALGEERLRGEPSLGIGRREEAAELGRDAAVAGERLEGLMVRRARRVGALVERQPDDHAVTVGGAEHEDGRALGAHEVAREAAAGRDLAAGGKVAEDALGEGRDLGLGREDGAQAREQRMEPPLERAVPVADVPRLDEGTHEAAAGAVGVGRQPDGRRRLELQHLVELVVERDGCQDARGAEAGGRRRLAEAAGGERGTRRAARAGEPGDPGAVVGGDVRLPARREHAAHLAEELAAARGRHHAGAGDGPEPFDEARRDHEVHAAVGQRQAERIDDAGVGEVVEAGRLGLLADEPQALDVAVEDDHVADAAGKAHGSGAPARSEEEHPRARLQVQEELPAGARRVDEILEGVLPRRPGELRPEACKPRLLGRA